MRTAITMASLIYIANTGDTPPITVVLSIKSLIVGTKCASNTCANVIYNIPNPNKVTNPNTHVNPVE